MIEIQANCVGRIVWGHPGKEVAKTDQKTRQPILRDGKPVTQWAYGVAYPKADFMANIWPAMAQEAGSGFPNGVPQGFAWKMVDGDGVDKDGKPYSQREGYAGCYVLSIVTEAFAPPIFRQEGAGYVQMKPEEIKTGDYVANSLKIVLNMAKERTHSSSLYINPQGVLFIGYGAPIVNGPSAQDMFGGRQFALPPGASPTPMMPAGAAGMPGTGAPQQWQPPAAQPTSPPPGYAPNPAAPPPGYQPTMPAAPAGGWVPAPAGPPAGGMPGQPAPGQQWQPPGAPLPPPAHDFVHGAGQPAPGQQWQPPGAPQQWQPPAAQPTGPPPGYAPPGQPPQPGYYQPAGYPSRP